LKKYQKNIKTKNKIIKYGWEEKKLTAAEPKKQKPTSQVEWIMR